MRSIHLDGQSLASERLLFSLGDLSVNQGQRVYELIRLNELSPESLEPFYFSMMAGMRLYRIPILSHYTLDFFSEQLENHLSENDLSIEEGIIRWDAFMLRGESRFSFQSSRLPKDYLEVKRVDSFDLYKDAHWNADFVSGVHEGPRP